MKKYVEMNGTSYAIGTPDEVMNILECAREDRTRIVLDYGDPQTGVSWGEVYDIRGYVGRSTGTVKIPLLVYNRRSMGGGGIITDKIIEIKESRGGRVLYSVKS